MLLAQFDNDDLGISLWFEDDGRVAYAYLARGGVFVADVWVYNRADAPASPEWKGSRDAAPYLNPREFVTESMPFALPSRERDVSVRWLAGPRERVGAEVIVGGVMAALIHEGDKPGFAAAASRDSPVARRLVR